MRVVQQLPVGFSFPRTVFSHGWSRLAPFSYDGDGARLQTVVGLDGVPPRRLTLTAEPGRVVLHVPGRPTKPRANAMVGAARRILNLDLDLALFHELARSRPDMRWIADTGSGRLLRCPTVFEDLIKLILTTNCSWALTTRMTRALVDLLGERAAGGERAFPSPRALAAAPERMLRREARTGYRAPLLLACAAAVARGDADPEAWEHDPRPADELKREIQALPGAGPYVAENLLRLLGRPAGPALDSWLRAKYARVYHEGRRVTDRTILRRYSGFGRWSGLALWCDMTRDWFDGDRRAAAGIGLA